MNNCNNYGNRLLQLCKFTDVHIANGRCGADAYIGKCTTTNTSLIDYVLLSAINFPKVTHFIQENYVSTQILDDISTTCYY